MSATVRWNEIRSRNAQGFLTVSEEGILVLYLFAKNLFWLVLTFLWRWRVEGRQNVPREGPLVVVANHSSYCDPIVVGVALPRRVRFMAKAELFHIPVLGAIMPRLGAFPVQRGRGDRAALREGMRVLEAGNVLGLFPEGTRSAAGEMLPFQPGAAMLALRSGAPLLPVAVIWGPAARRLGARSYVVRIGSPILCSGPEQPDARELSRRARSAVAALQGEGRGE